MNISELMSSQQSKFETFKSLVWPLADIEHYGDNQPNFSREKFTLLAEDDHQIIGYISMIIDTGVAQIEPLMVHPDFIGKDIGTKLLYTAEEKAREFGVHKIWLETGSDWRAKSFYEKHGYCVRAFLPNHTGGREFVLMDKMI